MKTSRWMMGILVFSLAGLLLAPGCRLEETPPDDSCETTGCPGAQACQQINAEGSSVCGCVVSTNGATCAGDSDCPGADTCDAVACSCISSGPPPAEFPAYTTGCAMDPDGYIVAGDSACFVEVDTPLIGATATLVVDATITDDGSLNFLDLIGFAETNGYEWTGYHSTISRSGTAFETRLYDVNRTSVANAAWTGAAGPELIHASLAIDSGATSASYAVTGASAPAAPLASTAMGAANSQVVVLAARNVTIHRVVVTEP